MIDRNELQRRKDLYDKGYWEIPENLDTSNFDFSWRPEPWDRPYIHQFGTQWQKTGGPRFIVPENEGIKYQSSQHAIRLPETESRVWRPLRPNVSMDYSWHPDDTDPPFIYVFGNQWYDCETMPTVQYRVKGATEKKYITDVKAKLLPNTDNWIIPDYITEFDYSWVPNPYDPPYEHQFPTEWHYTAGPKYMCESIKGLKYQNNLVAKSRTVDIVDTIEYKDSIMEALRKHKFVRPFVHITHNKNKTDPHELLKSSDSFIHVIDGLEAIVSERVVDMLYDKLTDYADIQYHQIGSKPELLDVIFISNGESCADSNYQALLDLKLPNRVVRVDGIKGRVASQHAAANISNTEWYFLVNAKLKINEQFDFSWQPDVLKSRRHYIFTATNSVNGLEYGHMAIVANNKTLTLNTIGRGLDFTMDSRTEVIDTNSGIAIYNSSKWDTWRTSFREAIKLSYAGDSESMKRLHTWTTIAEGNYSKFSLLGAKDAVEYYNLVNGELNKLMLSYDWEWLHDRFTKIIE